MTDHPTFDFKEGQRLKDEGMAIAADNRVSDLEKARAIARRLARRNGIVNSDMVGQYIREHYGITTLGPAAGSLFKGKEWEWTGEFIPSTRVSNHGRLLRVWRLR